jgi:four helix bundle protein
MADRINSFEEVEAGKAARELVRVAYSILRQKPASQDFSLKNQVERAAVSAMTNVAEGYERIHSAAKSQCYNIARACCGEVRSLSYVMPDAAYISNVEHEKVLELVAQTGRLVSGLIRSTRARTATTIHHLPSPIS